MRKIGLMLLAAAFVTGCSDNKISVSARTGAPTASPLTAADQSALVSGGVTITDVKLVIRRVRLETEATSEGGDSPGEDELAVGPFLIHISGAALDSGSLTRVFDADVKPGTYHEIKFEVHAVTDGDIAANSQLAGMKDQSVVIAGTGANGAFTFTSGLTEEQRHEGTFNVGEGTSNVTLNINPANWFTAAHTDPTDPQFDRSALENAIKASIDAFDDDDHDGRPDHS